MSLRSVLIFTFHFPPSAASGSFRMLGFARHLPKYGWRPIVVAPPSLHWEPTDPGLVAQIPPEAVVEYVPWPRGLLTLPLQLQAPYLAWFAKAWLAAERLCRRYRPEAILTSGPPHQVHTLGLWLKRYYKLPWIADFRDPWVATRDLVTNSTPRDRSEARQERAVMANADLIVANAPGACARIQDAFPSTRDRMVTITNGYDPETFAGLADGDHAADEDRALVIVHPGQLYAGRDPRPLLDALRDLGTAGAPGSRPIRFDLIGELGLDLLSFDLSDEIRTRHLEGVVRLVGQVPYIQSLQAMARADILLLLDGPGRKIGVPAKVYEYIGAGRPILALAEADGDLAWVLRESGAPYRIAPPGDVAAIKQALLELADSPAGPRPGVTRFTREVLTGELARHLDRCAARSPAWDREVVGQSLH